MIGTLGITLLATAAIPYVVYLGGIIAGRKQLPLPTTILPPISIIIPAYNEAGNLKVRFDNIVDCKYPSYEIILIDDCSTDDTSLLANFYLENRNIEHTVVRNEQRSGVSTSINKGIKLANHDIVVTTDADVIFKPDALHRLITRLVSDPLTGAVTGDLLPYQEHNAVMLVEGNYRSIYGKMCDWESAHDSTFNFNGALIAFKRSKVQMIEERSGVDDANTAFAAIRSGYRALYEKEAIVYEVIPESLTIQFKQKKRRAIGLLNAVWANRDLLRGSGLFARVFYPLRMWMMFVTPILFFLGTSILFISYPLQMLVLTVIGMFIGGSFISAFVLNQLYLVVGLLNIRKDVKAWTSTTELSSQG